MERFNQTLKSMLQKAAIEQGDQYHIQGSTSSLYRFLSFLNSFMEEQSEDHWIFSVADEKSTESVISHVLAI